MSAAVKREMLRLLKEDEEFRLAVAGLLGLDTILGELRRLRENFNRFIELEEKRWEENNKRWEESNKRWEGAYKRLQENSVVKIEAGSRSLVSPWSSWLKRASNSLRVISPGTSPLRINT